MKYDVIKVNERRKSNIWVNSWFESIIRNAQKLVYLKKMKKKKSHHRAWSLLIKIRNGYACK